MQRMLRRSPPGSIKLLQLAAAGGVVQHGVLGVPQDLLAEGGRRLFVAAPPPEVRHEAAGAVGRQPRVARAFVPVGFVAGEDQQLFGGQGGPDEGVVYALQE